LSQFEEQKNAYNMPAALEIEGNLNIEYFRISIYELVERHEILRTIFIIINGEPKQRIIENEKLKIENYFDYEDISENNNQESVNDNLKLSIINYKFDLTSLPLMKIKLIKICEQKFLLLFNMHHIISDGWSMNILIKDIMEFYNSKIEKRETNLKKLNIQYKDYALWQNELLDSEKIDKAREYWLEKFSGEIPVLEMPSDEQRPPVQTFRGNTFEGILTKDISDKIRKLCLKHNSSLFMFLTSAVKILLHRYTGAGDIIIGSPIAGRIHPDLANQIGFYVNTLALRDSITGEMMFKEFLDKVRETALEAYQNEIYPFDKLVETLNLKRDTSRSPVFDVMVVLQNNDETEIKLSGAKIKHKHVESNISKFDMTFNFAETSNNEITMAIEYNLDIYSESRINRLFAHFIELVKDVTSDDSKKISEINILPEEEKNKLIYQFNATEIDYPKNKTITQLFEEQVGKIPENAAVVFDDKKYTYYELNEDSNYIAGYLIKEKNIKAEEIIVVEMERSYFWIAAILGIMKAGGVYLPLVSGYPAERKKHILNESRAKFILIDKNSKIDKIESEENEYISIEDILSYKIISKIYNNNPLSLAYILYTSGSTGNPKGVMICHSGFVNMILYQIKAVNIQQNMRLLQISSNMFDASIYEIFISLLGGASLYIVPEQTKLNILSFENYIAENNITGGTFTPSFLSLCNKEIIRKLDFIITAGESANVNDLEYYKNYCNCYNAYGPTEISVCATIFKLKKDYKLKNNVPIGSPISNLKIYILNGQALSPINISGEICIAGPGLARGYLSNEKLTAEKFIEWNGNRIYRTGDIGRWNENGEIEFLGRIDDQVKIRGLRIELGEIESVLSKHSAIKENVVIAKKIRGEENELIAYYTLKNYELENNRIEKLAGNENRNDFKDSRTSINKSGNLKLAVGEIREFLGKFLPAYMIPAYFVELDKMPLNQNGKIDKKNLPMPLKSSLITEKEYKAPETETEKVVMQIWSEVLKIEKISVFENFFEIGGHSLKAVQVSTRIKKDLKIDIGIKEIFQYQTIKELAEYICLSKEILNSDEIKREDLNNAIDL
ncbi:amino acid adenylation domain-containing protein, partial [Candidatus Dependentiae bacterium]|nr:amino acid adenylation domain-containing protein [Candidatus Dependentiae bacterium]